jgi:hypothetical protein
MEKKKKRVGANDIVMRMFNKLVGASPFLDRKKYFLQLLLRSYNQDINKQTRKMKNTRYFLV